MLKKISVLVWSLCFLGPSLFAQNEQDTIYLSNPSLEGDPGVSRIPEGWINCGFPEESPPDIQPFTWSRSAPWGQLIVGPERTQKKIASDGDTYINLVIRDNLTWESIGQELKTAIRKETKYRFTVDLCISNMYFSISRTTGETVSYVGPILLKIYGGNELCQKKELLFTSPIVKNINWETIQIEIKPTSDFHFLRFEAFYQNGTKEPYNGHLMIDNFSPLVKEM